MTKTPTYRSWSGMKQRCRYPKHKDYHNYGGRGIDVCDEWHDSFETFYKDMGKRPKGMSIDRVDTNLGYFLENCRWADANQQARNTCKRSSNLSSKYKGVTRRPSGMYRVRMTVNGKRVNLGEFKTDKEAGLAYNRASLLAYGDDTYLNKIE